MKDVHNFCFHSAGLSRLSRAISRKHQLNTLQFTACKRSSIGEHAERPLHNGLGDGNRHCPQRSGSTVSELACDELMTLRSINVTTAAH